MKKIIPFFILFFVPTVFGLIFIRDYFSLASLCFSAFLLASIPCILNGTKQLKWFIPLALLSPLSCYYNLVFHNPVNKDLFSIFAETNAGEIRGYLGEHYLIIIAAYLLLWLLVQLFFILAADTKFHIKPKIRIALLSVNTLIVASYFLTDYLNNQLDQTAIDDVVKLDFEIENDLPPNELLRIYPINIMHQLSNWHKEKDKLNVLFARNQSFKFHAQSRNDPKLNETIVLVIGESSQRDHWQLQGYNRNTNPLLAAQDNLVYFNNATSSTSATMYAVPQIITRKPATQATKILFNERSVLSAFKEAGFKTYWISTQQQYGRTDTSTSIYIKEADVKRFLNPGNYHEKGRYDDVLIPALEEIMNDSGSTKKFIVIHTLGSHAVYGDRYPLEYEKFTPTPRQVDGFIPTSPKFKVPTVNAYDNSILYTDYVLSQFIQKLDNHKNSSAMLMYLSDHGEQLFSGQCENSLHGNKTENEFKIPLLTWYSAQYKKDNPQKVEMLELNKNKPIDQTSAFPTLIELANIEIKDYIPRKSLTNPMLQQYPRAVYDHLDFDKSKRIGTCKELS